MNSHEKDSLELARDAIDYTLGRIRDDENIRYHMGAFTEAYEQLKSAHCAMNGIAPEAVDEEILGYELRRKSNTQIVDEIRDIAQGEGTSAKVLEKILQILIR